MLKTLRSKILFFFLLVSLSGILIVSFAIQWGFEASFNHYINENREEKVKQVISEIVLEYEKSGTFVYSQYVEQLMHEQAMTESLYYRVYNMEGRAVIDSTFIRGYMEGLSMGSNPYREDNWLTKDRPLKLHEQKIGEIKVFYPKGFVDSEYVFLQTINKYILIAVVITITLALSFSMLISRRLTSGLNRLAQGVEELLHHKQGVRVPVENLSLEMKQLAISFNDLAMSLEKEARLRKEFTGDLAHELRTPLATLRSQIEAFQDGIWEPTPERLKQSHNELMRLVRLVNELEKLLAAENPQIRLNMKEIDAGKTLTSMGEFFAPSFNQKGVQLEVVPANEPILVKADHDKLTQILTNIINNALKYTPEGGTVKVSTVKGEQMGGFIIEDNGIGIAESDLPHIFERFYRAGDKSRARKTGGVGIGLSIVKALVEAHKGKINIESSLDQGTKITILLPLV